MNSAEKPRRAAPGARKSASVPQARLFERLGLRTSADFATHLPLRYEDETRVTPIGEARLEADRFVATPGSQRASLQR